MTGRRNTHTPSCTHREPPFTRDQASGFDPWGGGGVVRSASGPDMGTLAAESTVRPWVAEDSLSSTRRPHPGQNLLSDLSSRPHPAQCTLPPGRQASRVPQVGILGHPQSGYLDHSHRETAADSPNRSWPWPDRRPPAFGCWPRPPEVGLGSGSLARYGGRQM